MFGLSFFAALAISSKVEDAVSHRARQTTPPVAGPEQIDAHLDAFVDEVDELTAASRNLADPDALAALDEALADACARAEEWAV